MARRNGLAQLVLIILIDTIQNLNVFPHRCKDGEFDEIYLDNVLEHLGDPLRVWKKLIGYVSRGQVKVLAPYIRFLRTSINQTHKYFFTVDLFADYDPDHIICKRYEYYLSYFLPLDDITYYLHKV